MGRWLADSPTEYGFATELWSAPRLARLIEQEWGVCFHPAYLTTWLRRRGYTPQKPRPGQRAEHDDAAIALVGDRLAASKKSPPAAPVSSCWTRAGC